jgi:hypothetical protein
MERQPYTQPHLETIGSVLDLTRTGLTNPGDDGKAGSVGSGGQ